MDEIMDGIDLGDSDDTANGDDLDYGDAKE